MERQNRVSPALLAPSTVAAIEALLQGETVAELLASRQPVHVVYGGAHLFRAEAAGKLGALALRSLDEFAPDDASFAEAMGLGAGEASEVRRRVLDKLRREPVEDLRIDFEDGYGRRSDDEEDGHARDAAGEVARGVELGTLPTGLGLRIKALTSETRARSLRTLDLFFSALHARGARPPEGFVVTLPKVTRPAEAQALADALEAIERAAGWAAGALRVELMIEAPAALVGSDGRLAARGLVTAARGRCVAVHFGTYDYTAACDVTAAHQRPDHGACDLARRLLQASLAGSGVRISDGATTTLPLPPHRPGPAGLSPEQQAHNRAAVHAAWRLHREYVTRALVDGFYQGWDLHPAQLPARYAAVYAFFLAGSGEAGRRLRNFLQAAARATQLGGAFDDAATGLGLLNYFRRARSCGGLTDAEVAALTGLDAGALAGEPLAALVARAAGG